jgi:hypothetical protein
MDIAGNSVCQDTSFTSRSIFIIVPASNMDRLVKVLGEGVRRQFKPGSSHTSILKAPFIYITGDIRFELCFLQMKIGYRFNVEYLQNAGSSGKADNTAHVLKASETLVNSYYCNCQLPNTVLEFIRFERSRDKSVIADVAVLANASIINEEKMIAIKDYKKTFIGTQYEKDGDILIIPKDQFTKDYKLANPMHGLLLFEPALVNTSNSSSTFWTRCIITFHKSPRSASLSEDLLTELRSYSGCHISRKTLNETLEILKIDLLDTAVDEYIELFCAKIQKEYTDCNTKIESSSSSARKKSKPSKFDT